MSDGELGPRGRAGRTTRQRVSLPEAKTPVAPPGEVSRAVEHLFRHESGKMIAILTRIFGIEHLTLVEDVVQEALIRALKTWPFYGIPDNPSAWILRASRNLALDVVRREKNFRDKEPEIIRLMEQPGTTPDAAVSLEQEISDDRLRLMFVCCHPLIPAESQVALALKTLCGFNVTEISRAFLTTEASIAKRLTRAKQKIRDAGIPFEIPTGAELSRRLEVVLQALYLLFNEGYKASSGERLVREEICFEAIRLTSLLAEHAAGNQPKTHALLALMLLNAARFPSRVDDDGNLLRLQEQDRTQWDRARIARGLFHLAKSAAGAEMTTYHLQSGIAACHTMAPDYESTDWPRILSLYDRLVESDLSPVVALNRAIVISHVQGPQAGLDAVAAIRDLDKLESYYLLHAVLGELESRLHHFGVAADHYRKSLELAEIKSERAFLARRLQDCASRSAVEEKSRG
ncbi:MAG: sigma factor, ECF subfamily protein [Verrucomicrobia bacterium Tous-C9LFEB]|nr:MAG: sigma factor, ECF subfamily protein [Verrucomicrobia bacterium Tous-C9LFEB]